MSSSTSQANDPAKSNDGQADRLAADARAAAFGRIVALLMASPRHSSMTLQEAQALVAPAIALGQLSILGRLPATSAGAETAAAAWWAFVSPEVDARLTQCRDPHLTLETADWQSGDQPWIIESVGNGEVINELIRRLAETTFTGKPAKLRARLPDGRMAVGRIEKKPIEAQQTES